MHSISIASHVGWRLDKFVHLIIESGSSKSEYNLQQTTIHNRLLKAFENCVFVEEAQKIFIYFV